MNRMQLLLAAAVVASATGLGATPATAQVPRIEPLPIVRQLKPRAGQREEQGGTHQSSVKWSGPA